MDYNTVDSRTLSYMKDDYQSLVKSLKDCDFIGSIDLNKFAFWIFHNEISCEFLKCAHMYKSLTDDQLTLLNRDYDNFNACIEILDR